MSDPLKIYFKDIKRIPLLSAEEEVELAHRIRRGDTRAKEKMIKSNLRLVVNFANRYRHFGIPLMDLIEEGNMGLMRAVTKFNPKKGYRFSTYASWWIRQHIHRALANQGKMIRLPVYMVETIVRYKKTTEDMTHRLGRRPTQAEIARRMRTTVNKLNELNSTVTKITSLEQPIGDEGTGQFVDLIEDESAVSPDQKLAEFMAREKLDELLSKMKPRDKQVIELRYGLKGKNRHTLEEIAYRIDLTRERVRQIEASALKKLKRIAAKQKRAK